MLTHPSTELVARAPCQMRRAHARSVRAVRARLRQQRRLEVDKTRKRDVQTGGVAGAVEKRRRSRWHLINYFFAPYYRKLSGERPAHWPLSLIPTAALAGDCRLNKCRALLAQTCAPLRTSRCTTSCAAQQMRRAQPTLTVGGRPRQQVVTHQTATSCNSSLCL